MARFTSIGRSEEVYREIDLDNSFKIVEGSLVTDDFGRALYGTVLMKEKPIATFQAKMGKPVTLDKPLKHWPMKSQWAFVKAVQKKANFFASDEKSLRSYFLNEVAVGITSQLRQMENSR